MARWQHDEDDDRPDPSSADSFDDSLDDSSDDSLDEDPLDDDTDDSANSSFDAPYDDGPLPDPGGPHLITVVGLWLVLATPLAFLLPPAVRGLLGGTLQGPARGLAFLVVVYACGSGYVLWAYTRRYWAGGR